MPPLLLGLWLLCDPSAADPRPDLPPIADALRLPTSDTANAMLDANCEFRTWITGRLEGEHQREEQLGAALRETDRLWEVWDAVRDARNKWATEEWRRERLATLRGLIGPEAYYAGRWPAPIPLHRLQRID